jgi:hypothetical protein
MSPLVLIDRYYRAIDFVNATARLAFICVAPGAVLCAVAWVKWRREYQ